jgi:hypothetical protein
MAAVVVVVVVVGGKRQTESQGVPEVIKEAEAATKRSAGGVMAGHGACRRARAFDCEWSLVYRPKIDGVAKKRGVL